MKPPRGLSAEEADAWARVAATVKALDPPRHGEGDQPQAGGGAGAINSNLSPIAASSPPRGGGAGGGGSAVGRRRAPPPNPPPHGGGLQAPGLDSHWDRRFRAGAIEPDFTLDLHGCTLDQAHGRLDSGLAQAQAIGAKVVLVIAGKPRPVDAADRGSARGAIRAKLLDWLAAGPHGASVAAIRNAHRKHGGEGALYLVLRRRG